MNSLARIVMRNSLSYWSTTNRQLIKSNQAFFSSQIVKDEAKRKETKLKDSPKITLIDNEKIDILTLDAAKKISKRRDLKLVKILDLDTKTQRAVYKLMSGTEYHSEELKRREEKKQARKDPHIKGEKLLSIGSKIMQHDLQSALVRINKWLMKFYEVRVVINLIGENQKAGEIANEIESKTIEAGKLVQKRTKDGSIRFQIIPHLKKADTSTASEKPSSVPNAKQPIRSYHTI